MFLWFKNYDKNKDKKINRLAIPELLKGNKGDKFFRVFNVTFRAFCQSSFWYR